MKDFVTLIKSKSELEKAKILSEKALQQLTYELLGIEEENNTLREILSSSSDAILITTKDKKITYVNPAWEKLTGYSFNEVEGKDPHFLSSNKSPKNIHKQMKLLHDKGERFTTDQMVSIRKGGKEFLTRSHFYPVKRNSEISYFVQVVHDITKSKREQELRDEFLSASAHELKTPITVLKLLTQSHLLIAKKQGKDTIKASELELIDKELDKLIRLVNDILDSSRIETGRQFMSFEESDLVEMTRQTIEKIKVFAENHIIVFKDFPEKVIVRMDPYRMEQVLINLLSNAIKYSPENTVITVTIQKVKNNVVVSVHDQGIGVPKKDQRVIFDKYYQVKAKSKIGFGLGLYISKEIIARHKGKLGVRSQKNKGSTFFFSLPLLPSKV